LAAAEKLIQDKPGAGLSALQDLVRQFPNTKPAEEAQTLIRPLRERVAANSLEAAEKLMAATPRTAELALQDVLREYPGTRAAKRARESLQVGTSRKPVSAEAMAAELLQEAQKLIPTTPRAAQRALQEIIGRYQGTPAARSAGELVKNLIPVKREERAAEIFWEAQLAYPRNPGAAKARLQRIIDEFSDTKWAEAARKKLEEWK
jgi:outer membrane protein assembly factor BamD (BamD/ComL family)